ncbi:hypothetical protein [Sulfurospirillum diekertiae]|uniref:Uncharacterized protein n=1 Tax=Sulfurospirillum diekertiae TaxID=1854492 RepID=A0A1Y0HPG9_9BACT|nr:hypothetical protein [Sulfurospirillum diekertiae]ARU49830.1 hypothetical protein Sdiek1_2682 [Sulfurospirillum diekertiae]ASC94621.1 hypothetical protein Sdiek2_2619 [Sulfurospirillum diekertiae]
MTTEIKLFYDIDPNSPNEDKNFFIGEIQHSPLPVGTPPPLPIDILFTKSSLLSMQMVS